MIIAVYGNNGSGKSTIAMKLALSYARKKQNVVLVDSDYNAPQANVWYPKLDIIPNTSMSNLLDNNVDVEAVVSKMHKANKYMGILGYAKDFASNSIPSRADTSKALIESLVKIADITIIDCQSSVVHSVLTLDAIDMADVRVIVMSPDLRGLSWHDSNVRMFEEKWKNNKMKTIKVLNKTKITSPVSELEDAVGTISFCLPYTPEIENETNEGIIGDIEHHTSSTRYNRVMDSLAYAITNE